MIYEFYQAQSDFLMPFRQAARFGAGAAALLETGCGARSSTLRHLRASWSLFAESGLTHRRPSFGIASVDVGNQVVGVTEEAADDTPFGTLLHFRKDAAIVQPRVLLVAPMSGHFATLLRNTVEVMLPEHDMYITDWKNARDIPANAGAFGLDEFVAHLIRFLEAIGPGGHIVAVCQPAVAALAAVALMAEGGNPAQPRSMTLMAGPIDTRMNPTKVNELAMSRPIQWFEKHLIGTVPWGFAGARRRVYPGFLQLAAFISMNLDRHVTAHLGQFRNLVGGDESSVQAHRKFYGEYGAVMDLPAEFYLETVRRVFQDHDLPQGRLTWRGQTVRPEAIRRTGLLTVEGERDDICAIGQTMAALDLCSGIRVNLKQNHLQTGVGHYGVFAGKRWAREVYPRVREMIQVMNG
jgi:poly(3-hydroxybutyrate) depolymerase